MVVGEVGHALLKRASRLSASLYGNVGGVAADWDTHEKPGLAAGLVEEEKKCTYELMPSVNKG
jgi:hypothetical protein